MILFIARRLAFGVVLVFAVSIVVFVIVALTPGDATHVILGPNASAQQYAALRQQLGLNLALPVQYWHWLQHAVVGDLGDSLVNQQNVVTLLNSRLPVTLSLILLSTVIAGVVGISAGAWSAYRGGRVAKVIDIISMLTFSIPTYWLGLLLVVAFAVEVRLLPAIGYVGITQSPVEWIRSLILPVATLSLGGAAGVAKQTRDAMLSTLDQEFVLAHRADGVPERTIVFRHALRNCAAPILSMLGAC